MGGSERRPTKRLQEHHHLALHGAHLLFLVLSLVFTVLPAITGPRAGIFWLTISYKDGTVWNLGAWGACNTNYKCQVGEVIPAHGIQVHSVLAWHLTATTILATIDSLSMVLILHPIATVPQIPWITFLLPVLLPLIALITLAVDLGVKQSIVADIDVSRVETQGCFWLSIGLVPAVVTLTGLIHYTRLLGLQTVTNDHEERDVEQNKLYAVQSAIWRVVNPWAYQNSNHQTEVSK